MVSTQNRRPLENTTCCKLGCDGGGIAFVNRRGEFQCHFASSYSTHSLESMYAHLLFLPIGELLKSVSLKKNIITLIKNQIKLLTQYLHIAIEDSIEFDRLEKDINQPNPVSICYILSLKDSDQTGNEVLRSYLG